MSHRTPSNPHQAAKRGLLLVDTKYEFGKAADGTIMLIDEVCVCRGEG
jgi:phosphoribosylaminoimidazole-succinocarboxamide synthase